MLSTYWEPIFRDAHEDVPKVTAHTYLDGYRTNSRPVVLECYDGCTYVVKGSQIGRGIINEYLVAQFAPFLQAPIPKSSLINIVEDFTHEEEMAHITPGLAHGLEFISGCTDRETVKYTNIYENKERFARLATLYSWVMPSAEAQFIYQKQHPHLVYGIDHEHCLPNTGNWNLSSLTEASRATIDETLLFSYDLSREAVNPALKDLQKITDNMIVRIISHIPQSWPCSEYERHNLATYFARRRDELLDLKLSRFRGATR